MCDGRQVSRRTAEKALKEARFNRAKAVKFLQGVKHKSVRRPQNKKKKKKQDEPAV